MTSARAILGPSCHRVSSPPPSSQPLPRDPPTPPLRSSIKSSRPYSLSVAAGNFDGSRKKLRSIRTTGTIDDNRQPPPSIRAITITAGATAGAEPAALLPGSVCKFVDVYNASSTGHQVGENALGRTTTWRASRTRKLQAQFSAGPASGGGPHIYDPRFPGLFKGSIGGGGNPHGIISRGTGEATADIRGWMRAGGKSTVGKNARTTTPDVTTTTVATKKRKRGSVNDGKDEDEEERDFEKARKMIDEREKLQAVRELEEQRCTFVQLAKEKLRSKKNGRAKGKRKKRAMIPGEHPDFSDDVFSDHGGEGNGDARLLGMAASPLSLTDEREEYPAIFAGLTVFVNGSTHPSISDHKLKRVLAEHGAGVAIALAKRSVTHVILGKPNSKQEGSVDGAGGGLAGGKLDKEIRKVKFAGGSGVRYVDVEW